MDGRGGALIESDQGPSYFQLSSTQSPLGNVEPSLCHYQLRLTQYLHTRLPFGGDEDKLDRGDRQLAGGHSRCILSLSWRFQSRPCRLVHSTPTGFTMSSSKPSWHCSELLLLPTMCFPGSIENIHLDLLRTLTLISAYQKSLSCNGDHQRRTNFPFRWSFCSTVHCEQSCAGPFFPSPV